MMGKYFNKKPFAYKPKGFISSYELQELIKEISIPPEIIRKPLIRLNSLNIGNLICRQSLNVCSQTMSKNQRKRKPVEIGKSRKRVRNSKHQ